MEKATDPRPVLVKIFYGGALALLGWFFLSGIAAIGRKSPLPLLTALGFLALLLGAVWMTERLREKITPRVFFLLCLGAAAALGTAQLFAAKQLLVRPGWDFGAVHQSAMEYALHGRIITHEHYFERFSNNTGLLVWEIAAYRLLAMLGLSSDQLFLAAGIAMNLCAIDLAILFTVLFAGRVWGRARGVQALFLCMLFTPYVLYAPIFYTDSMSLPFTALPLYLFARYNDAKSPAARTALCGSIGLLLAFGTKVKGNIAVLLVAFCLYAAFNFGWKRFAAFLLAAWLPFFGFSALFDSQVKRMGLIHEENLERIQFPTEYWFYMGLKDAGGFNQEDFEFMYGQPNRTQRQRRGRAGIARRLAEMGPAGMARHLTKKSAYTFGDGSYFLRVQLNREAYGDTWLRRAVNSRTYLALADGFHVCLLLLLLFGLGAGLWGPGRFDYPTLLYVALFGLALFLMMWETRSRYLLNFSPLMLLAADHALDQLRRLRSRVRRRPSVPRRGENTKFETQEELILFT